MHAITKVRRAAEGWRTGSKVEANLYQHDARVAMCRTEEQARTIVALARLVLALVPPGACSAGPCPICTAVQKCAEELDA